MKGVSLWVIGGLGVTRGNLLLKELSKAHIRQLLEATEKVSEEELVLATPPPTQEYGKFDPHIPSFDVEATRDLIKAELDKLGIDEVSKKVLDVYHALSKVSILGSNHTEVVLDAFGKANQRRLNPLDLLNPTAASPLGTTMTYPGWGSAQVAPVNPWQYNPYASMYGMPPTYGSYGPVMDPWGGMRPSPYTHSPFAYYAPPMVPGMNMMAPMRSVASSPQASDALLQMMLTNPLYAEVARPNAPVMPATPAELPQTTPDQHVPETAADLQSILSSVTADLGNSIGERVGTTLGTGLAADLNLINGVAQNFRTMLNGSQYPFGYYPAYSLAVPLPKRRLAETATNTDLQNFLNLLNLASAANPPAPVNNAVDDASYNSPFQPYAVDTDENLAANSAALPESPNTASDTGTLAQNSATLFGANPLNPLLPSVQLPTPIPLDAITADSVANVWNNAMDSLTNTSQQLNLPILDNFNATLPDISTVGNAAGLNEINEVLGSNLGASLGSTMGNLAAGTSSLITNYISGAKEAFLSAFSPNLGSLLGVGSNGSRRMLSEVASRRRLDASVPACATANRLYRSSDAITFNNVDSLTVCQMICQTYSDAGRYFANCASPLTTTERQCVGVSFSEVTGRCSIFYSIEDEFTIEGFSSAPLHCNNSTFVQTQSRVSAIQANTACSNALDWTYIRTVADSASPASPDALLVGEFPSLPPFVNNEAPTTNIWHYNPDTPVTSSDGSFVDNIIYQLGYGVSNTDGYWGQSTNITDWRYCAWLCTQQSLCTAWTYFFNPETYSNNKGGCTLATNTEPAAAAISSVQTISGPRMSELSVDLFGSVGNTGRRLLVADPEQQKWVLAANPPKRQLNSPYVSSVVDPKLMSKYGLRQLEGESNATQAASPVSAAVAACEDSGFAYRSLYSTSASAERLADSVTSFVARTPEACATSCQDAVGCVAWQYLPEYTISSDARLQESQITVCALLSSVGQKIPSVPQMISGINVQGTCSPSQLPQMAREVVAVRSTSTETPATVLEPNATDIPENLTGAQVAQGVTNVTTCVDSDGQENHFANGVSVRGRLLSDGNNVLRKIESPEACRQECESANNCTIFSWGQWQGCYLMETVEAFVSDTEDLLYSGYRECRENSRNDSARRRLEEAARSQGETLGADDRSVITCGRAKRGSIYTEGTIISQVEDQYADADACWAACRTHPDCFFMSYITAEDKSVCVFFSDVEGATEVAASVATSAESHCDVLGDIDFDESWWQEFSRSSAARTGAVVGGTVGGLVLAAAAVAGGRAVFKRRKVTKEAKATQNAANRTTFLADLTPSVDGEGTSVSQQVTHQSPRGGVNRKRNVFGMASPGALERGSPTLHVDDFEKVEPKSTGKRLRRYF